MEMRPGNEQADINGAYLKRTEKDDLFHRDVSEDLRAQFEAWALRHGMSIARFPTGRYRGQYLNHYTQYCSGAYFDAARGTS